MIHAVGRQKTHQYCTGLSVVYLTGSQKWTSVWMFDDITGLNRNMFYSRFDFNKITPKRLECIKYINGGRAASVNVWKSLLLQLCRNDSHSFFSFIPDYSQLHLFADEIFIQLFMQVVDGANHFVIKGDDHIS